jgi:hypothetical protein
MKQLRPQNEASGLVLDRYYTVVEAAIEGILLNHEKPGAAEPQPNEKRTDLNR